MAGDESVGDGVGGAWAPPQTRYAQSQGLSIAFQTLGDGPRDLVFVSGFVSHLELAWDWPQQTAFYRALASFSRLILFDKRGTGLSDRAKAIPATEERMDDLRAVMDAAGSERAAIVGVSEGAPLAISFAAAYPDRVSALVLYAPLPKASRAPDYPWAETEEWWEEVAERFAASWGSPEYMEADVYWRAPSEIGNPAFLKWWSSFRRLGASPGAAADLARMNSRIDVRPLLPKIQAPTLVLARTADRVIATSHARYVAERIPGAEYLELAGEDHLPFVGDAGAVVNAIARAVGHDAEVPLEPVRRVRTTELGDPALLSLLTERELEIVAWVRRGKTNAEIATALYIAESTVRKHLENVYRKLGVTSRTAALARLTGHAA